MDSIIKYEQAAELKKLGFNEPSLGYYTEATERLSLYGTINNMHANFLLCTLKDIYHTYCLAPFYHDTFKWFRKKGYGIEIYSKDSENKEWYFVIKHKLNDSWITYDSHADNFDSQETAELECLKLLITIEKENIILKKALN